MKFAGIGRALGALLALHASIACAKHSNILEDRHGHHRSVQTSEAEIRAGIELRGEETEIGKRGEECQFPTNAGLVAVTPDQKNAGWAMSPDQLCVPDSYCPYACPPGQLMAQWDPKATSYTYPLSMHGGLYCDKSGNLQKPFPNKPYCVDGVGNVGCINKASSAVAFCQTVLPGNEAMLIPTSVESSAQLAVPDQTYWARTAAHYYINPPGISTEKACVWGTSSEPYYGNWSPYVAGANKDSTGNTFVKLAWNPKYIESTSPLRNVMPTWGVEIVCDGEGCNGLPCAIDPSTNTVNQMTGSSTVGDGGAVFIVVTVPQGVKANFVVFEGARSGAKGDSHMYQSSSIQQSSSLSIQQPRSISTPTPTPTPSSTSSSSSSSASTSILTTATPTAVATVVVTSTTTIPPLPIHVVAPQNSAQNAINVTNATAASSHTGVLLQPTLAHSSGASVTGAPQSTGAATSLRAAGASLTLCALTALMIVAL